jgi:seryl-tRNA synthetase
MIHNFTREDHKQIKEDVQEMKSFVEQFEALKLERDALWVKTQEDERIINELNDAVKEKKRQRDEAIELVKELMPFAKLDLDFDRFGVITDIQARFEELMLEVS